MPPRGCDLLAARGRLKAALGEMALARQLDPLDAIMQESECYLYMLSREYNEAERRYTLPIDQAPDLHKAYTGLGRTLALQGRYPLAVEMLDKGRPIIGDVPSVLSALGQAHSMSGNKIRDAHF